MDPRSLVTVYSDESADVWHGALVRGKSGAFSFILFILVLGLAAFFRLYQLDSVPPGLYNDEARNGLDVLEIFRGGYTPLMFDEHEPLFIYLQAASVALLGQPELGLRLVAVLFGIATVGATFVLANKMFNLWVALLASTGLATSLWYVIMSRVALRANSVPLLTLLSFYFLWVGLKREKPGTKDWTSLGPYIVSGLFLGLCIYTYISSRTLPLVIVLFLAWLVMLRDLPRRRGLVIFLAIGATAALVFAPLGLYFLDHPVAFFNRLEQASLFPPHSDLYANSRILLSNIAANFGMFTFRGDALWRYNISLRPVFDPISSVFFVCGLIYALYRIRSREYSFLIIWLLVMFLPGLLSSEAPYSLRLLPLAPVAYIFFAVGLVKVGTCLFRFRVVERLRLPLRRVKRVYWLAVAGLMLATALITFHDLFRVWAFDPRVFAAYDGGETASAKFLNSVEGEPVVMAVTTNGMPPHFAVSYLSRAFEDERWYDDRESLVIPHASRLQPDLVGASSTISSAGKSAILIFLNSHTPWPSMLERVYPQGRVAATGHRPDGEVSFTAYTVPDVADLAVALQPRFPFKVGLGKDAQTLGYDLDGLDMTNGHPTVQAGQAFIVTLYWRPLRAVNQADYKIFVHLVDGKQSGGWGQFDNSGYPAPQWHGDELVLSLFRIEVPDNAPSGKYNPILGMYSYPAADRLKVFSVPGKEIGDYVALPPLKVEGRDAVSPKPMNRVTALFGDSAKLIGYDLQEDVMGGSPVRVYSKANRKLGVTLYWQGAKPMKEDYTVFVQLLDSSGKLAAQSDGQPVEGTFPTSFWDKGDIVTDRHELTLPATPSPGQYNLIAGMYLLSSGERLRSEGGADAVDLGTITVD